jgi:hypothetical protein
VELNLLFLRRPAPLQRPILLLLPGLADGYGAAAAAAACAHRISITAFLLVLLSELRRLLLAPALAALVQSALA